MIIFLLNFLWGIWHSQWSSLQTPLHKMEKTGMPFSFLGIEEASYNSGQIVLTIILCKVYSIFLENVDQSSPLSSLLCLHLRALSC